MSSITWRPATQDELERCAVTDEANVIDGAGAVLRGGELIGLTNEYGTCVWTSDECRDADAIERLSEAAVELL